MNNIDKDSDAVVVIPARFKSTRFPGKPLAKILGKPMIVRVASIASEAVGKNNVFIATDDERIASVVSDSGFSYIMTSSMCETGTDRVAEAWRSLKNINNYKYILNLQGDEPALDPRIIIDTIKFMKRNPGYSVNCFGKMLDEDRVESKNLIKMITGENNQLIYASRSVIPGRKEGEKFLKESYKKQIAVYGFTPKDLEFFGPEKKKTPVEKIEDIEIIRLIENGVTVLMKEVVGFETAAVDTQEDISYVERILRKNRKI